MPRRVSRAPFWLVRDLKRRLVQELALQIFAFRVLEGAAAWWLCYAQAGRDGNIGFLVHGLFVLYFLLNGILTLTYREGRVPAPYVLADIAVNLCTTVLAAGLTGGLTSPLVLMGVMKVAGYAMLFSHRIAIVAAAIILATCGAVWIGGLPMSAFDRPAPVPELGYEFRLVFLCLVLSGAVWLFSRVAAHDGRVAVELAEAASRRAAIAREADRAATGRTEEAHTESVVLAGVAETLSSFSETREILNKVVEIARGVLWWDYCFILLWDERAENYYCSDVAGFDAAKARQMRGLRLTPEDEPDLEWVRRLGHCAVIAPRSSGLLSSGEAPTLLTAPIYGDGEFVGVMQFARTSGQLGFTTNDLRLADRLVARTSGALQRARQMREQRQADRLAAAGELAAVVAHEVNNALTGILGQVESVRGTIDPQAMRGALRSVEGQARRIASIIEELLGFGRPQEPERIAVDVVELVRETIALMEPEFAAAEVRVDLRPGRDLHPVLADREQIQQVLVNLFKNAVHAMLAKHTERRLRLTVRGNRSGVALEVEDTGTGIAEENLQRIFDPFFSTKKKGTGLGLSVCFNIVRAHGGELSVSSQPNIGTRFIMRLPVAIDRALPTQRSVLVIDDEPEVAASLEDMLVREGMTVRCAASGEEALAMIATEKFDAIFLDVRLPDISGPDVYRRLAELFPDQASNVIFVTGGLWRFEARGLRDRLPPQPMLRKPCTAEQIREALRLLRDTKAAA